MNHSLSQGKSIEGGMHPKREHYLFIYLFRFFSQLGQTPNLLCSYSEIELNLHTSSLQIQDHSLVISQEDKPQRFPITEISMIKSAEFTEHHWHTLNAWVKSCLMCIKTKEKEIVWSCLWLSCHRAEKYSEHIFNVDTSVAEGGWETKNVCMHRAFGCDVLLQ